MRPAPSAHRRESFTLVEMLVAVTILSLMLALMFSMVGMVFHATNEGQGRIDNSMRARVMLDVLADDIEGGVFRPDLPAFGTNNGLLTTNGISTLTNGASAVAFYTRSPGILANARNLSLVIYRLDGSTNAIFRRDQLAVPWTAPASNWSSTVPFQGELSTGIDNATSQNMAEGVVGFSLFFCRADQSITNVYSGYQSTNPVVAVGVALAMVDTRTLQILNQTGKLNALTQALGSSGALTGTNSAKADWDVLLESSGFFQNYPAGLSTGLKTFERIIPCTPPF